MNPTQDAEFLKEYLRNLKTLNRYKCIGETFLSSAIEARIYAADEAVKNGVGIALALAGLKETT